MFREKGDVDLHAYYLVLLQYVLVILLTKTRRAYLIDKMIK